MSAQDDIQRTVLPIPDQPRTGLVTYDAKDPDTQFPPITPLRPPKGAPNVGASASGNLCWISSYAGRIFGKSTKARSIRFSSFVWSTSV
jgi:hypothetical protein